jgi:soluble lytic murein transglycosylase-like protein
MHPLLVAVLLAVEATQVHAALGSQARATRKVRVTELIVKQAYATRMDPVLVAAIVSVENPRLDSAARGGANVGIMQVHPAWLRRSDWQRECGSDLTNVETNICFGVRVLRAHLAERESVDDGLLAYNGCRSEKCRGYATKVLNRRAAALRR